MVSIIIDNRERELAKLIPAFDTEKIFKTIEIEPLHLADLIIEHKGRKIHFERKSLNDLASSIKDGRYKEQSMRLSGLAEENHNIYYIIEGNLDSYNAVRNRIPKETIYSTIISLSYFKGFSVIRTNNTTETTEVIISFANKLNKEADRKVHYEIKNNEEVDTIDKKQDEVVKYTSSLSHVKKDNINKSNIGAYMLSCIPGISTKTCFQVLENFNNSLSELCIYLKDNNDDFERLKSLELAITNGKTRKLSSSNVQNIIHYLS